MIRLYVLLSFVAGCSCSSSVAQDTVSTTVPVGPMEPVVVSEPVVEVEEETPNLVIIPESDRTRVVAVLLARVAINENTRPLRPIDDRGTGTAGEPTSDAKAMIQEQVAFAAWKKVSLLDAIQWQSKYVSGGKEPKPGTQHIWTSTLPARGSAMPEGWHQCTGKDPETGKAVPKGCDGRWEIYADNWVKFRDWMIKTVVKDGQIEAECDGTPITWGCDQDNWIAINRGLCVIEGCGDKNAFWALPGQGCDEAVKDVMARDRELEKKAPTISVKEILEAMRRRSST